MKIFDFENSIKLGNSPVKVLWLKENKDNPITEGEYIAAIKSLRGASKNRHYNPSYLRNQYRNLKNNFGFFSNK